MKLRGMKVTELTELEDILTTINVARNASTAQTLVPGLTGILQAHGCNVFNSEKMAICMVAVQWRKCGNSQRKQLQRNFFDTSLHAEYMTVFSGQTDVSLHR